MRASPSGKAQASQACIRGFESRRPLHELPDPALPAGSFSFRERGSPEGALPCDGPPLRKVAVDLRAFATTFSCVGTYWNHARIAERDAGTAPASPSATSLACYGRGRAHLSRAMLNAVPSLKGPLFFFECDFVTKRPSPCTFSDLYRHLGRRWREGSRMITFSFRILPVQTACPRSRSSSIPQCARGKCYISQKTCPEGPLFVTSRLELVSAKNPNATTVCILR